MCLQAIFEIIGSAIGFILLVTVGVIILIALLALLAPIIGFLLGGFIYILLIIFNPLTWVVLIILGVLGFALLK